MQLSDNFSMHEFTRSQEATRKGIDNTPSPEHEVNMRALCVNVLEKIRAHYKRAVNISSGYRSLLLNAEVRGSATSQHCNGEAADIEIFGVCNYDLACWIRDNCNFDQLILEFYDASQGPASGWVHVSFSRFKNRKISMTAKKVNKETKYTYGIFPLI